jgi:hypothetical protein
LLDFHEQKLDFWLSFDFPNTWIISLLSVSKCEMAFWIWHHPKEHFLLCMCLLRIGEWWWARRDCLKKC